MQKDQITIHTDGGSRGNPGPAACAFVVENSGEEIFKGAKFLGKQTNNFAEYSGVILALQWVTKNFSTSNLNNQPKGCQFPIIFYLDSELVVKQINGLYRVKDENLKNLFA